MHDVPSGCDAALPVPFPVPGGIIVMVRCGEEITARYRYACVHEHVNERGNCPAHEPVPGDVGCLQCLKAGHDCKVTFIPLEAPGCPR